MTVALVFFNKFRQAALEKKHNFATDTFKVALVTAAPDTAVDDTWSDVSADEVAAGNGYVAGGQALDSGTLAETGGVATVDAADEVITASGGAIGPFRYVVMYNDTATNKDLVCYWDLGSSQSISDGQSLNLNFAAAGIFTLV